MAKEIPVLLPDIGDFKEVEVVEVLVSVGDRVEKNSSLITLESDKASMEIPSPEAGVVVSVEIAVGDKILQGDRILTLKQESSAIIDPVTAQQPQPQQQATTDSSAPEIAERVELVDIQLPDIGDFNNVEVIEILASAGEMVARDTSLITLESEKASMEVPSPYAGKLVEVRVKLGDKVNVGDVIAVMELRGVAAAEVTEVEADAVPMSSDQRPAGEKVRSRPPVMPTPADMRTLARGRNSHASPAIRRFARELGVDLALVAGSGPKSRVLKEDVQNFIKQALQAAQPVVAAATSGFQLPAMPEIDFTKFGAVDQQPISRIKKLSGAHLHRCWLTVPQVTQFDQADITELEAFRAELKGDAEKRGVKLTLFPFLLKACASAIQSLPEFNSSLSADGESLILKRYIHIGVAVDTPNGLVVPVIRDVDKKSVFDLAQELMVVSSKAREGKLLPADMQGGTFSISSLGGVGGTAFTPIVNAPEVAILGVSRSSMQPVWNGSEFKPRLMLPLSLSYDHRVIDGVQGARFTTHLAALLSDIRRLLL